MISVVLYIIALNQLDYCPSSQKYFLTRNTLSSVVIRFHIPQSNYLADSGFILLSLKCKPSYLFILQHLLDANIRNNIITFITYSHIKFTKNSLNYVYERCANTWKMNQALVLVNNIISIHNNGYGVKQFSVSV